MITAQTSTSAAVRYQIAVLDSSDRVVRRLARKSNLILDQGLDGISEREWANSFVVAVVGTGMTPTKRDSGAVTFSRAGNVVSASAGFFDAADVGRLLKFDTGEEVRISVFTNATTVTTTTSGTIAAAEGTIWYVNQTGLSIETKRSNTYSTGAADCGTTFAAGVYTMKRTFLFSAEASTVTYREVGWSHTTEPGGNLFGRDLLAGGGITLVAGQQLKVSVELVLTLSPLVPVLYSNVVTGGFGGAGFACLETLRLSNVISNGQTDSFNSPTLEPGRNFATASVSTMTAPLRAAVVGDANPISGVITGVSAPANAYVPGSFSLTKTCVFGVSQGNSSAIRSLIFCDSLRILLDAAATKADTHTLSLTWGFSWGRTLSNA